MQLVLGAEATEDEHEKMGEMLDLADYVPVMSVWCAWARVPSAHVLSAEDWLRHVRHALFQEREAIIHDGFLFMPRDLLPEGFEGEK